VAARRSDGRAWADARIPAVPARLGREAGFLHFEQIPPAVGPGAVDIGEAVLACQPARGVGATRAPVHIGVCREGRDRTPDEPRAFRDRGKVGLGGRSVFPALSRSE
jgi:hypothetical protein